MFKKKFSREFSEICKSEIKLSPEIKTSLLVGDDEFNVGDLVKVSYIKNTYNRVMRTEEDVKYPIFKDVGKITKITQSYGFYYGDPRYFVIDCSKEFLKNELVIGFEDLVKIEKC